MRAKVFWIGGVVLLLLASLGACVSSDSTKVSETAVSDEIDQIFEEYIIAFNNYDLETVGAVLADGYMLYETSWDQVSSISTPFTREYDRAEVLSSVEMYYPAEETHWERIGEAIMTGNDPWLVSQVIHVTSNNPLYPNGIEGVSILTIIDEDGTLKVARDVFVAFEVK